MATIKLSRLSLVDRWPGVPSIIDGIPADGWDGTSHAGITGAPAYPPGTKIQAYQDGTNNPGPYTCIYAALGGYSDTNHNISAGSICSIQTGQGWCAHADMTLDASESADPTYIYPLGAGAGDNVAWYVMHACQSAAHTDLTEGGRICLPCSSLSAGEWGWFWVGGVCPCGDVTFLDSTPGEGSGHDVTTLGDVLVGAMNVCYTGASCLPTMLDFSVAYEDEGTRGPMMGYSSEVDA